MSIFRVNEVQFSDDFNRDDNDSTSISGGRFDLNTHRYPNDLGTSRNNHYMLFEIFVRENINTDFNVDISGGDPVDYIVRRALSRSRGSGQSIASTFGQSVDSLLGNLFGNFTQDLGSDFLGSGSSGSDDPLQIRGYWDNEPALTSLYDDPSILGYSDLANDIRARARTSGLANRLFQQLKNDISKSFNTLKKARESIALYIPDTLNFDYVHNYNDLELSRNPVVAMAQNVANFASMMGPRKDISGFSPFVAEIISTIGGAGLPGSLEAIGVAINPQYEVVFQSTSLRNFQFDFMFYPRDEREAESVYKIIRAFKFHAAPEIVSGGGGRYLLAPSAFDISFFYNGQINPNIPKISTCVCTSVQADYAPNGFSAYEMQNETNPRIGKTGSPVATRLQLQFKEMTMITKELLRGDTIAGLNDTLGGSRGSF
jgi:hypothetical protein